LERITALEERFDGLSKTIEALAEKIDTLIEQGVQRGQAMSEMRSDICRLGSSVAGLKGDTPARAIPCPCRWACWPLPCLDGADRYRPFCLARGSLGAARQFLPGGWA